LDGVLRHQAARNRPAWRSFGHTAQKLVGQQLSTYWTELTIEDVAGRTDVHAQLAVNGDVCVFHATDLSGGTSLRRA
jgi:hypothetical protein